MRKLLFIFISIISTSCIIINTDTVDKKDNNEFNAQKIRNLLVLNDTTFWCNILHRSMFIEKYYRSHKLYIENSTTVPLTDRVK